MAETKKETIATETRRPIKKLSGIERAKMLSRILTYRTAGVEWGKICKSVSDEFNTELKMTSAHRLYNDYLKSLPKDALETARLLSLHRLDSVISEAVIMHKNRPSVKALEIVIAADKRISELLGLEAPVEIDVTHIQQEKDAAAAFESDFTSIKKELLNKAAILENTQEGTIQ